MEQKDYYQILGVEKNADAKKIKESYRELALKYHPDRNADNPEHIETMKLVNEAYAVLSDPKKRKEYDGLRNAYGAGAYSRFRNNYSEQDIFNGSDIFGVFEELAKTFNLRGYEEVFKEFYGTGYRKFEFQQPGFFAKGFVFTGPFGQKKEQNTENPKLQKPGTLGKIGQYVLKKLTGVEIPADGADIDDFIHISPELAQKGGPYAYLHAKRAKKLIVKIPPGIREGQKIRLQGMGDEGRGGGKNGDLYIRVHVRQPVLKRIKAFFDDIRNDIKKG